VVDVDVDEVVDTLQGCIILALEVKAIGQQPRMDVLISFQKAYVMHLHSHRLPNSTYLVLLPQETPRWLYPIAYCLIWHATGETYLLLLTCYVKEIAHTIWMFVKTVPSQALKMMK